MMNWEQQEAAPCFLPQQKRQLPQGHWTTHALLHASLCVVVVASGSSCDPIAAARVHSVARMVRRSGACAARQGLSHLQQEQRSQLQQWQLTLQRLRR
jgi:sirohydrochlorin ferrochelatase